MQSSYSSNGNAGAFLAVGGHGGGSAHHASARWTALAGMASLHVALLLMWLNSRPPAQPDSPDLRPVITWLRWQPAAITAPPVAPQHAQQAASATAAAATTAAAAAAAAPPSPSRATASPATSSPANTNRTAPVNAVAPPAPLAPPTTATPATLSAAAPSRSADDILQEARRDIGKIDQDLRAHTWQGKLIKAPANTPEIRLAKGFDAAAAVVPNKWYEKPKVETLLDPGGYGRRIYRVTGALGTYCITVESNHAPDGIDVMKNGIQQKLTDCGPNPPPVDTMQGH